MYGTCETLCRALAAKYPGDTPLMLVIWSPEEIQALADGMDISLSDHEIRTVLARLEDIPEDQRIESGISSGVAMEIINNVRENRQVTVPAELLASLIQTAEQALWKREWAARDYGLAVPECVIRDVLLEDVAQRNIPLSHKKLRRALKAITRSESYLCAMKAGACRYDTEGYVTEHISQEEEAYAAERLDKIRRQNRIKAELQAVLDEK